MSDVSFLFHHPALIACWMETLSSNASRAFIVYGERACSDTTGQNTLTLKMRFVNDDDIVAGIAALGTQKDDCHFVGFCTPSMIRVPSVPERQFDCWTTHVVMHSGARATRLKVPDSPALSGPTSPTIWDQEFANALEKALGISTCVADPNSDETRMYW